VNLESVCHSKEIRLEQGFEVYVLRNTRLEIAVVPELGAKIISLKNLRTGREWMWHPEGGLKLFRNRVGDDFSRSPLVGADECLPTVAPCTVKERRLPDHGEVWSAAWRVNLEAWKEGVLQTSLELPISPFQFERTLELRNEQVRLDYRLENRGLAAERFLWALHPLLKIQAGDRLRIPATTRTLLNGEGWIDAVDSVIPDGGSSKVFAGPLREGVVGVFNPKSGERLSLEWDPNENDTLGLWLTRGGWHGHHHLAIEPTNGAPDPLSDAAKQNRCGAVPASGSKTWRITLRVEP
jgi:galactose mutarotase-like enzyme